MTFYGQHGWGCFCLGCCLIRSGMCPQCAARVMTQIAEHQEKNEAGVIHISSLCSDACGAALERYTKDRGL